MCVFISIVITDNNNSWKINHINKQVVCIYEIYAYIHIYKYDEYAILQCIIYKYII